MSIQMPRYRFIDHLMKVKLNILLPDQAILTFQTQCTSSDAKISEVSAHILAVIFPQSPKELLNAHHTFYIDQDCNMSLDRGQTLSEEQDYYIKLDSKSYQIMLTGGTPSINQNKEKKQKRQKKQEEPIKEENIQVNELKINKEVQRFEKQPEFKNELPQVGTQKPHQTSLGHPKVENQLQKPDQSQLKPPKQLPTVEGNQQKPKTQDSDSCCQLI